MANPRRNLIRPAQPPLDNQRMQKAQKVRSRLEHEQRALARWLARLKRAFTSVQKQQKTIARLERQLRQLEVT